MIRLRHTSPDGTVHLIALEPYDDGHMWACRIARLGHRAQPGRGTAGYGRAIDQAVADAAAKLREKAWHRKPHSNLSTATFATYGGSSRSPR